jgi:hypothetical protein
MAYKGSGGSLAEGGRSTSRPYAASIDARID